jgi:cysteinyl-tRNA synthetase
MWRWYAVLTSFLLWGVGCNGHDSVAADRDTTLLAHSPSTAQAEEVTTRLPLRNGSPLSTVRHWLYLLDVDLNPETVDRIVTSTHDMVVLDFIPSEVGNADYPIADVVAQLHGAPVPKLVLAYVDIGEAESYRTYWQPGWRVGDPDWIAGEDPDGWAENHPVAFWRKGWHDIWLGEDGYLKAIVEAGYDGVYLDWVEAYSDENVLAMAQEEGSDARQEMIVWVSDLVRSARARRPGFLVVAQNAAELVTSDTYTALIDGIAQEQVWFDGGMGNDPPGDCPLPRTDAEVDTLAYRASLSRPCRRQYDGYPESTLHTSSESYLRDLALVQRKGLVVFTVDYAIDEENVTWIYATSRALGFVPLVSSRALDRYVEPVP